MLSMKITSAEFDHNFIELRRRTGGSGLVIECNDSLNHDASVYFDDTEVRELISALITMAD